MTQQPKYSAAAGLLEIEIAAAFEGWAETNFKVNVIGDTMVNVTVIVDNQCNVMLRKTNVIGENHGNFHCQQLLNAMLRKTTTIVDNQYHVAENHFHCGQPILCCRKPSAVIVNDQYNVVENQCHFYPVLRLHIQCHIMDNQCHVVENHYHYVILCTAHPVSYCGQLV